MSEEKISPERRPKIIGGTRNYFHEEINQNDLMSEKQKNACTALNYIEHLLILASVAPGCVSIFAFTFLFGISISIVRFALGLKICAITAVVKKYK